VRQRLRTSSKRLSYLLLTLDLSDDCSRLNSHKPKKNRTFLSRWKSENETETLSFSTHVKGLRAMKVIRLIAYESSWIYFFVSDKEIQTKTIHCTTTLTRGRPYSSMS